jgi:hypothetical protein
VTLYLTDKMTTLYIMKHEIETALRLNAVSDFRGGDCEDLDCDFQV